MSDKDLNPDDFNADDMHFSEEELEAAMAGFEREFNEAEAAKQRESQAEKTDDDSDAADVLNAAQSSLQFEDELQGLLGNRAKTAPQLLAAFCQISDISAQCVGSEQGAVAILRNLDGDGPEAAARDITTVVAGMPVILAVNRADKLEAILYVEGESGQTFAPPVLFTSTASFVEDLMLGITDLDGLKDSGLTIVDSADLDRDDAMKVIAEHTRFGRGGAAIE